MGTTKGWTTARELFLALPGVEEATSYGTPSFHVRKKFLARLWDDGASLVLRLDMDTKEFLLRVDPAVFHTTSHYDGYPAVLVRLERVPRAQLAELIEQAWRARAPKRVVAQYDAGRP